MKNIANRLIEAFLLIAAWSWIIMKTPVPSHKTMPRWVYWTRRRWISFCPPKCPVKSSQRLALCQRNEKLKENIKRKKKNGSWSFQREEKKKKGKKRWKKKKKKKGNGSLVMRNSSNIQEADKQWLANSISATCLSLYIYVYQYILLSLWFIFAQCAVAGINLHTDQVFGDAEASIHNLVTYAGAQAAIICSWTTDPQAKTTS